MKTLREMSAECANLQLEVKSDTLSLQHTKGTTTMHVIQIMLIKADSHEQALADVAEKLEENPSWSDWHNAEDGAESFAGRWMGLFGEGEPDYLCYGANPEKAEEAISDSINNRMEEYERYRREVISQLDMFTEVANSYNPTTGVGYGDKGMVIFRMKRLAQILNDEWTSDSGIYDLHNYTPALEMFRKDVIENPNSWWLIPVDFHH
jgi:hypothetical protein